jgi:hypothetical protein
MPLPILPASSPKTGVVFQSIGDRLTGQGQKQSAVDTNSAEKVAPIRNTRTNTAQPFSRIPSGNSTAISRNQDANAKAIAISQGSMVNPLIPLVQNVNQTLIRNT